MRKIYLILIVLFGFSISCTKNFEDFNTDEKNPAEVEGEFLFSNGQKELLDQISSTNVNLNVWKLFSQYWTETTYTDESNYDIVNRTIADFAFDTYYRLILKPFDEAKILITADPIAGAETEQQKNNKLMIIELLEVYSYHNLVNTFGDVPYTEALNVDNINPVYDDAATIYNDLLSRIDAAISGMNSEYGSYVSADLIYGGDVSAWIKFANSLKLKIAINLADVNSDKSKTNVEAAVAAGVFTSAADNALFAYQGSAPNTNKLHEDLVLSGRKDFVPANTIIDLLNNYKDPRLFYYMQNPVGFPFQKDDDDNLLDTTVESGAGRYLIYTSSTGSDSMVYKETPFILTPASNEFDASVKHYIGGDYGESSSYPLYSHINSTIEAADFSGILMTYSEIQFYIAEAAARGFSVGQTTEEAYNEAITASILFWGGNNDEVSEYLALPNVDYATATANLSWQEVIGTQSYISFYTRGLIGYTQYRRLDYPAMNVAPDAVTGGQVPTRFTYPINEQTLNAANYSSAASAIGGDDLLTRIFWDTADPQ